MNTLKPDLLAAFPDDHVHRPEFRAVQNAHGVYNTQQFVLRLSPHVHNTLSKYKPGITTNSAIGFDGAQAMSTLLHETIHWWQHIGSTYGFIFGLNYPMQSHATHHDLKRLAQADDFKKSVVKQAEILGRTGQTGFGTLAGAANTIINNHFDLLTFRTFTLGPDAAKIVTENNLFENVGHAFNMTYGHTLNILGSTVDKQFQTLVHPQIWEEGFKDLKERKVEGYFYGSPIGLWPIGSREIFEGQARFSQIQYLSHACGHHWTWDDYRAHGMLSGVYISAFEYFLQFTESEWPDSVNDPLVGLFLLVCDLSINPGRGFPFTIAPSFETFIHDVNPGARFFTFSNLIALHYPAMKSAVHKYERNEYEMVTGELAKAAKDFSPTLIAETFSGWFSPDGPFASLRREYEEYSFEPSNFVIRHLFAHFLSFQEDKAERPEFFCWPGAWLAGEKANEHGREMFEKHGALFVDKEDDDSVFARLQPGRSEATVQSVFNEFYSNAVVYDLTDQWISRPGQFRYDVSWLAASAKKEEAERFLKGQFKVAFELDPDNVEVL